MALNDKQRRFVDEYLVDSNATQAAIRAGYSAKTAGSQGHDLLKHPEISQAIQEGQEALSNRATMTAADVIERLAEIARTQGKDGPSSVQVSACKLLGDYYGIWTGDGGKKVERDHAPDPSQYEGMDPAELSRIYREQAKEAE